jgi:hypothetical protein
MADARRVSFLDDVSSRFAFLTDEFGFGGPEQVRTDYVGYKSEPWQVWVVLELGNRTVGTYVRFDGGGQIARASVWDLVVAARVRGAGQSKDSGLTRAGVQKSLSAQAAALRLVMPRLLAEDGKTLIE